MTSQENLLLPLNGSDDGVVWMHHAIALAKKAQSEGEVPIGAIVIYENQIIGEGWNQPISHTDPTAHAEIIALRQAAAHLGNYRLNKCSLYVTLEPCIMCAGAMIHARIERLVYAATDPKAGAVTSTFNVLQHPQLNHHVHSFGGVLEQECSELLRNFFLERRVKGN